MMKLEMDTMTQGPVVLMTVFAMAAMLVFLGFCIGIGVARYLDGKTAVVSVDAVGAMDGRLVEKAVQATMTALMDSAARRPSGA